MSEVLPIFDETGLMFGTLIAEEKDDRKHIFFKDSYGTLIEMPNFQRFVEFLQDKEIPQEEINKALRFFQQQLLGLML
jgi:hypothetical protein